MANEKLLQVAPDLTRVAPRSPRAPLGAYGVLAARMLDKCRAELAGKAGDYSFQLPDGPDLFQIHKDRSCGTQRVHSNRGKRRRSGTLDRTKFRGRGSG
jgi:Domain of unknown function (DUF5069)